MRDFDVALAVAQRGGAFGADPQDAAIAALQPRGERDGRHKATSTVARLAEDPDESDAT